LLDLTPETIVKSNWTYCPDSMHRLGIPPRQHFPIDECVSCGFIYAGLLPAPAFLAQVYDGLIDTDAARRANLSRASLARKMGDLSLLFQLFADSVRPVRLLDYGCGFGPVLELLRCLPDIHGIGYETSAARLQELRNRGLSATGELDHVAREAPFDVVLLDNVLEHLPQPRHALEFVRGVCANGAVVYISVPAIDGRVIAGQRQAAKAGGRVLMDINPWEHLNYFNLRSLDKLLDEFGFRPLAPTSFPNEINIGLRGSPERTSRLKNGLASFGRLCRFVWRGEGISTVNRRFYRLEA
jgi:SAM-dependent methyltransferase